MQRRGSCGLFPSVVLRCASRHLWREQQQQPQCSTSIHSTETDTSGHTLTMSLLSIIASGKSAGETPHGRELQPMESSISPDPQSSSADVIPQLLRALLLRTRQKVTTHHLEQTLQASGLQKASGEARYWNKKAELSFGLTETVAAGVPLNAPVIDSLTSNSWFVAFHLFSDALQHRAFIPSIEHINMLLGITVQEKCWLQTEQVEAFVDRLLISLYDMYQAECKDEEEKEGGKKTECGQKFLVDKEAIHRLVLSLQPTSETYDWLMKAAVSQKKWVEALQYFQDARDESLPVSVASLRLALQALRIGGVHSFMSVRGSQKVFPFVPLRTNQRGPLLRRAAAVSSGRRFDCHAVSQPLQNVKTEVIFLWEVALMIFSSFRHRVQDSGTVMFFMSMMREAGKHQVVLETYLESSRTMPFGNNVLSLVSDAAREEGKWTLSLRLLQHSMATPLPSAEYGAFPAPFLEDALHVLRRTRDYSRIVQLHAQIPSFMWTPRARVMLAQAAMVQREIPLLLRLLDDEADDECGVDVSASRHFLSEQSVLLPWKQIQVEVYNAALCAVQMELVCRHFFSRPTRAGIPNQNMLQNLSALSVYVYEQFLCIAKRQLCKHECGVSEHTLSVYAPLVKLLDSPAIKDATLKHEVVNTTVREAWETALSHVALIRKPDAVLVSLVAHVLQQHHQWEASFAFLTSVIRDEETVRDAVSVVSHRQGRVHTEESSNAMGLKYHFCPSVTAVAIRYAVWSASLQPSAAMHLIQAAFSQGWIDSSMAMELLRRIKRDVDDEHRCRHDQRGLAKDASNSPNDTVISLLDLISLYDMGAAMEGPFVSILLDTMRLLQQLQTQAEPPIASLHTLLERLNKTVAQISGETIAEERTKAELVVMTVLHAIWQQVGASNVTRRVLWGECLRTLQWFRSPLMQESRGVLQTSETTLRVLSVFLRRCDRTEKGFVEGLILGWLLVEDAPLIQFGDLFLLTAVSPALANSVLLLSQELLLEALVWSSRHRMRALVQRIVGPVKPLLLQLLQGKASDFPAVEPLWKRLQSEAFTTATVVVQCVTSGPHEDVLHDWPLVQILMVHLLQVHELTMVTAEGAVSVFADGLGAVLDKLRRTFHFLTVKISLDAYRRRGRQGVTTSTPPTDKSLEYLVEVGAVAYMDLCEAFVQHVFNAWVGCCSKKGIWEEEKKFASRGVTTFLDKILNCIWDVNYTLYVWHTLFSEHSSVNRTLQECIKDRYRRLLCIQVSLLPIFCTTLLRVQMWLVVMSAKNDTMVGTMTMWGGDPSAALVNDITTLETWQSFYPSLFSKIDSPRELQQFVVPLILDAIHIITLEASRRFSSIKRDEKALKAPHNMFTQVLSDSSLHSIFEDHISLVSPHQLQTMQQAGCSLIYMMLCEGRADLPQMVQKAMSWSCCPRALLGAILEAVNSTSREVLAALWCSSTLVIVFEMLRAQIHLLASTMEPHLEGESQAAALLRLLTTSPSIRAIARVDEEICMAALLALVPDDVVGEDEPSVSLKQMICRLLCAFPKVVETRLLSVLLDGQLHQSQLHVVDSLMQYALQRTGTRLFGKSPALMRAISMWILLRSPHDTNSLTTRTNLKSLRVFTEIMLSNDARPRDGSRIHLIRAKVGSLLDLGGNISVDTMHAAFFTQALEWKQALQLLDRVHLTKTPHVDLGKAFFLVMDIYGTCVPKPWRESFFVKLMDFEKQKRRSEKSNERCSLAENLIDLVSDMPTLWDSLLLQKPVELSELQQVGEKIRNALQGVCDECVPVSHIGIWNSVFSLLGQQLRNRSPMVTHLTGDKVVSQHVSLSCLIIERLAEQLICHGVRVSSPIESSQWHVNLPLVVTSLLLLVELTVSGRVVLFTLQKLYERVFSFEANSYNLRGTDGRPSLRSKSEVWSSLFSSEVQFLALPGLMDNIHFGDGCDDRILNAFLTKMMVATLFRSVSDVVLRLEPTNGGGSTIENGKLLHEDLLCLLELCGQRIASWSIAMLLDTVKLEMTSQVCSGDMEHIIRWYVQSALMMGAWRSIYWLASQLLVSVKTALMGQEQKQQRFIAEAWQWIVCLLPAMVASSMRSSSSLGPQISSLVEEAPSILLQQIQLPISALDGHGEGRERKEDKDEWWKQRIHRILIQLHQRVLLKIEGMLGGEKGEAANASFSERLSLVQPLVQLGVLLGVQHADSTQKASLRGTMFFFLSDDQWLQLLETVTKECERDAVSRTPGDDTVMANLKVTRWDEAIAFLCHQNKEALYCLLSRRSRKGGGHAEVQLENALHTLHVSCIVNELPWCAALELFCRFDGPPHVAQVFPAVYSELVVRSCPSWSTALHIIEHSLSMVPRPTQVQQLLAHLVLHRMRTDPEWPATVEIPPQCCSDERAAGPTYGGVLSWEIAFWCYHQLTRDPRALPLPQRNMLEILRHCVFHPDAALSAYEAYWRQTYRRTEGVNVFLSLLRAGRLAKSERLTLRAMWDYIRCCDEHDRFLPKEGGEVNKRHVFTVEGNGMVCRAFTHACLSGIVSQKKAVAVAAALKQRRRIGEVEELVMVLRRPSKDASTKNKKHFPL